MTRRILITALYVIAAAIMLLSALCIVGITRNAGITNAQTPFREETEPTVTEKAFLMKQNEPTVIHITGQNEKKLLSWESSDESILTVDSGGRLDAF
ncbi:hypothetical protein, partial [Lachnoclostridium sp. MSJ-17]|uniref:hypothetical protein n=1 Tax=Lachnoclostridium sp. MSJ-17 TaxID=2841516 RepID=UPI001C0FC97F